MLDKRQRILVEEFARAQVAGNDPFHGMPHVTQVAQDALMLAKSEGADMDVCLVAGMLHDICKSEEGDHGAKGAQKARAFLIGIGLPEPFVEKVADAIAFHNKGFEDGPIERKVLWDADKLRLVSPEGFEKRLLGYRIMTDGEERAFPLALEDLSFYSSRFRTASGRRMRDQWAKDLDKAIREIGRRYAQEALKDCVIVIDKPPGMICHEVTTNVKRLCRISRSGHAGTLDPEVSGVLPIALGRATKLLSYIAGARKTYVGLMRFRRRLSPGQVEALFARFRGTITQTPPKVSAVRKRPRRRTVHKLELLEMDGRLALFLATVDAGTYIRTLCHDIGRLCGGARMEELRRTQVGRIGEGEARTMSQLSDALFLLREREDPSMILPMIIRPESLIDLPKAQVSPKAASALQQGARLMGSGVLSAQEADEGQAMAIYQGGRFIGVGRAALPSSRMPGRRGVAIVPLRIHKKKED